MSATNKLIEEAASKVPILFLEKLLKEKLSAVKVKPTKKLIKALTDHILDDKSNSFKWKSCKNNLDVKLEFTDEDVSELQARVSDFLETKLPKVIRDTNKSMSKTVAKELKSSWPKEYRLQKSEMNAFKKRIEKRWGKAFKILRMILASARELGDKTYNEYIEEKSERPYKDVLIRLHARSCQVTDEILLLLESGYADGAMARWRTLHEIWVVAATIEHFDEDIAERYIAHEAIEAKRAMDDYERCCVDLGYEPLSELEKKNALEFYNEAIKKYGEDFKTPYGWASKHLKKRKPTLADLEDNVEQGMMRSHYQMASYNIHASPKGVFFKLGVPDGYDNIITGPSNAGLAEPGQNAANTLAKITSLLFDFDEASIEDIIMLEVISGFNQSAAEEFADAEQKLLKDDKK